MGKLKILPAQLANMIAAGEVVQRPASVVKELMENAVDAGATQISVVVTDAGRTLLQVIDNGCGMSPMDAVLCFERHATSKIATAEDLEQILTYGFRGEALASIAAVAEVTLRTRRPQDETATEVRVGAFGEVKTATVAAPVGSNFAVRNLFYNTPARRKFLKSDNVELKHILEEFTRVALTRPDIAFTLSHNGRELYVLKKAKSLKFRILDLLGSNVVGDIVDLSADTSVVRISGFVGRPDTARKTPGNQYLFVNGRIDVNIHPTKTEIKFEDDAVIFQILYACVKETLGRNSFGASIDFNTEGATPLPQLGDSFEQYKEVSMPVIETDPGYDPFRESMPGGDSPVKPANDGKNVIPGLTRDPGYSRFVDRSEDYGKLFEEKTLPLGRLLILQGKYILTPAASGLMLVHIGRARERILYEQTLSALGRTSHVTQTALFPVQVQVGAQQRLLFEESAPLLTQLGFDIVPFGNDTVVVNGVPEGYSCEPGKVEQLVSDLVYILSEDREALPEMMQQRLAEKFATLGASHADPPCSPQDAQRLIDTLFACDNAELTPSGRRIISIVPLGDIDKRF